MSKNSSIPPKTPPAGVNEAAVMECVAECKYSGDFFKDTGGGTLEDFLQYCDAKVASGTGPHKPNMDHEVQIIRDYVNNNAQAGSYEILNVTSGGKVGTKVLLRGTQADGSNAYFVGFQGTLGNEWYDNAEGMVQTSTKQQEDAADYFDEMVGKYGISGQDHVVVTGHSKGGNKAQYVTMASANADLIDSCVALDGQGFSPEAVDLWKQYPDVYENRRKKIVLLAGEYDYVHVLGERIATDQNTYYVAFNAGKSAPDLSWQETVGTGNLSGMAKELLGSAGDEFMAWHRHQYLFQCRWDPKTGDYVFSSRLESPSVQSEFSQMVQDISDYLMTLPPEERLSASATVMSVMAKGTVDGYTPSLADFISMLSTLHNLIAGKLERWDAGMLAIYGPHGYLVLKTIQTLSDQLEEMLAKYRQAQEQKLRDTARSIAGSDPYIYIDTQTWSQLGATMRTLGGVNYAGIRSELISIQYELDNIAGAVDNVLREAGELRQSANELMRQAQRAIDTFREEGLIEGLYATIEAAYAAVNTAKETLDVLVSIVRLANTIWNSVKGAICTVAYAIQMFGMEDTVRALGNYLSDTAQNFELMESQNLILMKQWEG